MFERLRDLVFGYDLFISYDFDEAGSLPAGDLYRRGPCQGGTQDADQ